MVDKLLRTPKAWEGGAFLHVPSLQRTVNRDLSHLEKQLEKKVENSITGCLLLTIKYVSFMSPPSTVNLTVQLT